MIVRISGEGQFSIDDAATAELNRLDSELEAAVNRSDEAAFTEALRGLLDCLERRGETAEATLIRQRVDFAAARADTPVAVSCFCASAGLAP